MRIAIPTTTRRELAHRVSDGLEITLYWDAEHGSISVEVYHAATEETITFPVAREHALDAFPPSLRPPATRHRPPRA